jgi:UDP-N-acetylglucosamine 3-dehydrogenase
MRFAVIGLGIGRTHCSVLTRMQDAELVGVCDLNAELAAKVGADCGVPAFGDWEQLVAETGPQAVCLCTNPATHLPIGAALAQRGIHVLCEKPMAPDVAQCLALTDACEKAGVVLMVAQKKRFAPATTFLKEHVGTDFGRPLCLNYRYQLGQVPKDWFWREEDGGGPIVENSVHCFDLLRYVIGEVKTVRGVGGNLFVKDRAPQVDIALGLLEFECGCVGAVELGTASEWSVADEELSITCEDAVIRWYGSFDRPSELRYLHPRDGQQRVLTFDYSGEQASADFEREIANFIECIHTGGTPRIPGADAARSIGLCVAMKQAVREGGVVEPWH